MKRSLMAVKMARYYQLKRHRLEEDSMSSVDFMSDILELVEELGMLPPPVMVYTDKPDGNTLCSEQCVWEDE